MTMNKLRVVFKAVIVIVFVMALQGSGESVVILRFGMFVDGYWEESSTKAVQIIDDAIDRFEASHPNVRVEYESGLIQEDYSEWLAGRLLKGTEPDVFLITNDDFRLLCAKQVLLNISPLIESDALFDQNVYYPALMQSGKYERIQYALPYEAVPTLMCVNKTLLEKENIDVPKNDWTWSDFHAICRKVTKDTDGDGRIDQFGIYNYSWQDAAYSNGALLFDEAGEENYVNSQKMINAVNFVYKIHTLTGSQKVAAQDFEAGRVAFYPMLLSDYQRYKSYPWTMEKYTGFEWTCISMPAGPQGDNISKLDSLQIGISARTTKQQLAWEFLKTLTYSEETQMEVAKELKTVSPLRSVTESSEVYDVLKRTQREALDIALLTNVMEKGVSIPKFKKYEEALLMMNEGIANAMESEKDIRVLLIILHRDINDYLNS